MTVEVLHGDCCGVLAGLGDCSVDAVVTDPPYELGFMGKAWDGSGVAYQVGLWAECLRVLKPGGHLLAFGGTRTYHRMTVAIEDAGFEVRDSLHWLYGSGFPKSLDVSKAIDKAAGAEREVVGTTNRCTGPSQAGNNGIGTFRETNWEQSNQLTAPATDAARQWAGFGTALKPAHEPIVVARKPLVGTVAATVLEHGTGALNIDGCRVGYASDTDRSAMSAGVESIRERGGVVEGSWKNSSDLAGANPAHTAGRWPANLVLTHAADCADRCAEGCPVAELDGQSGVSKDGVAVQRNGGGQSIWGAENNAGSRPDAGYGGTGGASRFFTVTEWDPIADVAPFRYVAKPSKRERNAGLDTPSTHPTVKPVALMRWLVRLVTPPGGTVLDPFAGSGTTLVAATLEGFDAIGIEMTDDYLPIIDGRVKWAEEQAATLPEPDPQPSLFEEQT